MKNVHGWIAVLAASLFLTQAHADVDASDEIVPEFAPLSHQSAERAVRAGIDRNMEVDVAACREEMDKEHQACRITVEVLGRRFNMNVHLEWGISSWEWHGQ